MLEHDKIRHAVEYLNAERSAHPEAPLVKLVDEAARRFDLDAAQSEWLLMSAVRMKEAEAGKPKG